MSRRAFISSSGAAFAVALSGCGTDRAQPIARVAQGALRGTQNYSVRSFKGVPYAAPPIGALRFRPPQPPLSWQVERDAGNFGFAPIQPAAPGGLSDKEFLGAGTSEDCLYLNIWQPQAPGPHPVLVWIHGGGNMAGAASQSLDGSVFAQSGIVCVTVGYRLGAFGFVELGPLLGPDYIGSGNNGLRDQIAALQWVQQNISEFGGDPKRVTLGGVSAGAKNVVSLMGSPAAKRLFQSVIVQSGGEFVHDLKAAHTVAEQFAQSIDEKSLLNASAETINRAQMSLLTAAAHPFPFRAITGTELLPLPPLAALSQNHRRFRALIGSNRDEAITMIDPEAEISQANLSNLNINRLPAIWDAYEKLFPSLSALQRKVRLLSAAEYGAPTFQLAQTLKARSDAWLYRFAQQAGNGPFSGWAPHGYETLFAWKSLNDPLLQTLFGAPSDADWQLSHEVHERWCEFIKGKAPNITGAARWPQFDGKSLMEFSSHRSQQHSVNLDEMAIWTNVPA